MPVERKFFMCNERSGIARKAALNLASKRSYSTPSCEVPFSFSFRSYRGSPV